MQQHETVLGNVYDKYHSRNPVARRLMDGFLRDFDALLAQAPGQEVQEVLEVGCGEGHLLQHMHQQRCSAVFNGIDLDEKLFREDVRMLPRVTLAVGSAYELPFPSASFDLVIVCEVMEHLEEPERALLEIERVAREYVILSVPREPLWRILNMARGSYIGSLGNTPGHVRHWSAAAFANFVAKHFDVLEVRRPLPWTQLLARKRCATGRQIGKA